MRWVLAVGTARLYELLQGAASVDGDVSSAFADRMGRSSSLSVVGEGELGWEGAAGAVVLRGVTKRYGDLRAVDRLSLGVRPGEFLSILGPSGSGKTTTMRLIGGFVDPDEGSIEISGRDVRRVPAYGRDVHTVFQSYALFPHMTVEGNVGYGLRMKGVSKAERRRRVGEMLEVVRLSDFGGHRPGELSGGMQQRVALARALVNRPSVLLLDEPLGSLDRKLREDMQIELRQLHRSLGMTFIYVTHDQDEALSMSDRVVIMRGGRVEQEGVPAEVYDDPVSLWAATFVGSSNLISGVVRGVGGQVVLEADVGVVVSDHPAGVSVGERGVAVVRPDDVRCVPAGLAGDGTNCVRGRLAEMLTVGKQVRLVAETAGGLEIVARRSRSEDELESLEVGSAVVLSWRPDAVRVYRPDGGADQEAPMLTSEPSVRDAGRS
jgi:spermidine/putrescine transport system ATP-binding protein